MNYTSENPSLRWKDLSGDEVYHIAHIENESFDHVATILAKAAFTDYTQNLMKADAILAKTDNISELWLASQALVRGLSNDTNLGPNVAASTWFNKQLMEHPQLTGKKLADKVGVSGGHISGFKHGNSNLSQPKVNKLVLAIADSLDLTGAERTIFISESPFVD